MQTAKATFHDVTLRKSPPADPCNGATLISYSATIEYRFGDVYEFDSGDGKKGGVIASDVNAIARDLQLNGRAASFQTGVKLEEKIYGRKWVPTAKAGDCDKAKPGPGKPLPPGENHFVEILTAIDPNDIDGPAGVGAERFLAPGTSLPYAIHFENDPEQATAPAQEVTVIQTLDPDLDWSTFELGDIQFGSMTVPVPAGLQTFQTQVDYQNQDGSPLRVDVAAGLNLQTGVVTWTFHSVDPATGLLPTSVLAGFLPVDDATGRGEGSVRYLVSSRGGLATGTTIDAQASVVFDTNDPLATNVFTNTMDRGGPTSAVQPLPAVQNTPSFTVRWTGSDDPAGSGIATFDVFVSEDGGAFTPWLSGTAQTEAVFTGQFGHRYAFATTAVDRVGHLENTVFSTGSPTLLASLPTSSVQPLTAISTSPTIALNWGGAPGAGAHQVVSYDILVSDNGGAFVPLFTGTSATSGTFMGFQGHRYRFYSIAVDEFGSRELPPAQADAETLIAGVTSVPNRFALGADPGGPPVVRVLDTATGREVFRVMAFDGLFRGGVRTALGDVNRDGVLDVIAGAGPGGGPHVQVFDGTSGQLLASFYAFAPDFTGGVFVAAGDVNGDGLADVVVGADAGGGPHVRVFNGADGSELMSFYAFPPEFSGGVRVAAGDVNHDGRADVITGAGPGGGPHLRVFEAMTGTELLSRYVFDPLFTGGVNLAAGDVQGRGRDQILVSAGSGGGPHVLLLDGLTGLELASFYAFDPDYQGGVRVGVGQDVRGNAALLTLTGPGFLSPTLRLFDPLTLADLDEFFLRDALDGSGNLGDVP
jgi:hypothetical protein